MNDKKWGVLEYLTVGGIGMLIYNLFKAAWHGSVIFLDLFKWVLLFVVITWGWIGVYELVQITPTYVWKIILVTFLAILFLVGYNVYRRDVKRKELKKLQDKEYAENLAYAEDYLANLSFHYYDFEKKNFLDWLKEGQLKSFRLWDEAYRLDRLGAITGKYYVCHLLYMTDAQRVARRDAAWEKVKDNQRQAQLKKNAEIKKARKESAQ